MAHAEDVETAFALIGAGASELGFEYWAYGLRFPLPFTKPRFFTISNYDRRWVQRYETADYLQVDPTVVHGCLTPEPLIWNDFLFAKVPQFWSEARSFGLCVGWAQSCFDGTGQIGMLSLARSHGNFTRRELASQEPLWRGLANVAHMELSARLPRNALCARPMLTARQVEVLKWTADGKTCEEVAEILGLSDYTVQFHVENAMDRLGAGNKSAAVACATRLGLLV